MYLIFVIIFYIILFLLTVKFLRLNEFSELTEIFYEIRRGKPILSALFQVNPTSQRHGGELVADGLKAHDVKEIFTLCGGHISPILVACENLGIKVFDTRHEVNAVFAADCVARLRQNIGVAVVTAGPGITNSITGLKNAQMAESPLLLIGGAAPTLLRGRGALQDINQQVLIKPLCKFSTRVRAVTISIAKSDTPGPVFVELPIDVLYPYSIVEKEIGFSKNPKGPKMILEFFLRGYISWVFGAAWRPQPIIPLPINTPMPKQSQINSLINLISSSQRPLLLLGSQAVCPPVKPSILAKAVETLGIPVYLGGMSRGLLGANSSLQMVHNRKEALQNADLVILAGTVCDFRLSYGRILNPKTKIVVINRNRSQMLKNHGLFWRSTLAIQADVASTIVQLSNNFSFKNDEKYSKILSNWFDQLNESERLKEENNSKKALEKCKDGKLNPLLLLKALQNVLNDDTILVADGGDFVGSAAYMLRPRGPLQWLDPGAFGTLGVGGGFALGAKAVHPDKPVLILFGDGACGFSLMEFDTFVRHKLPICAIIGNDACWSQIARDQIPWFNSVVGCELAFTNYEKVGEGLGANGAIIDEGNIEEIEQKLKQLLNVENSKPIIINAIIGKTNFREGSISV
uniref:2-hydroxyacyl-CoA lyase 2 n=1 Tax=Meloidogyne hapla TaxID=6305 RepID=A0A1I8BPG0_MELHA